MLRGPVSPAFRHHRRISRGTQRPGRPDSINRRPQPSDDLDTQASCLGIADITAHRAVFADGPVDGLTVLIHRVGSIAAQLARRDGAHVLAVVVNDDQFGQARQLDVHHAFRNDDSDLAR